MTTPPLTAEIGPQTPPVRNQGGTPPPVRKTSQTPSEARILTLRWGHPLPVQGKKSTPLEKFRRAKRAEIFPEGRFFFWVKKKKKKKKKNSLLYVCTQNFFQGLILFIS